MSTEDVLQVCGLPGCGKPWLGELPYCTYRHQHQHEYYREIVANIESMRKYHDCEGLPEYLFCGDQWNDETAEDILGVLERGGLHVNG